MTTQYGFILMAYSDRRDKLPYSDFKNRLILGVQKAEYELKTRRRKDLYGVIKD